MHLDRFEQELDLPFGIHEPLDLEVGLTIFILPLFELLLINNHILVLHLLLKLIVLIFILHVVFNWKSRFSHELLVLDRTWMRRLTLGSESPGRSLDLTRVFNMLVPFLEPRLRDNKAFLSWFQVLIKQLISVLKFLQLTLANFHRFRELILRTVLLFILARLHHLVILFQYQIYNFCS